MAAGASGTFIMRIPDLRREIRGAAAEAMWALCHRIEKTASANAPQGETGYLKGSFWIEVIDGRRQTSWGRIDGIHGEVSNKQQYASFVEIGTGIYGPMRRPIRPRRAKYMHWIDAASGRHVFAASVRGQKPQPYLVPAAVDHVEEFHELFDQELMFALSPLGVLEPAS